MHADRPSRTGVAVVVIAGLLGAAIGTSAALIAGDQGGPGAGQDGPARPAPSVTATPTSFWTVVLASVRDSPEAADEAERVRRGLRADGVEAQVLDSSEYASLEPGFLVVHSGRFPDRTAAEAHLRQLRAAGAAGDAYVREARRRQQ